jgi:hypothetical protein
MSEIIALIIWIASGTSVWLHYRRSYSEGGIWEGQRPQGLDLIDIFTPLWNTIVAIIAWGVVGVPKKGRKRKGCPRFNFFTWFYRLNKKD